VANRVEGDRTIAQPIEVVFETLVDPERQVEWDVGGLHTVEKLTPGPLGKGSRYRGTFKRMGKVDYEFSEYDPPRRFAHLARMPAGSSSHVLTLEEVPGGTRLHQVIEVEPNLFGKIAWPVFLRSMIAKRIDTVGRSVEEYLARRPA